MNLKHYSSSFISKKEARSYLFTILVTMLLMAIVVTSTKAASLTKTEAEGQAATFRIVGSAGLSPVSPKETPSITTLPGDSFYREGVDLQESGSFSLAADRYQKAAERHHPRAQYNYGILLLEGKPGVVQNKLEALKLFTAAAYNGHTRAQFNLGLLFEGNKGVSKDEVKARDWYARAAAAGFTRAKNKLALMLEEGRGGKDDVPEAVKIYESVISTAEAGEEVSLALTNLARLYLLGLGGLSKNPDMAITLLTKAAEKNFGPALFNLGLIQLHNATMARKNGDMGSVEGLYRQALASFKAAMINGYDKAYYFLATMLEDGNIGVKKLEQARQYYRLSASVNCEPNYSPIHMAAKEGRLEAIQEMVESGADLTATNRDNMTALKLAIKYGHKDVITFIQGKLDEINRKESVTLEEQIRKLREDLSLIAAGHDEKFKKQEARIEILQKEYEEKKAIEEEIRDIKSQEHLKVFYRQFMMKLEEFFLAYKNLNTGYIVREDDGVDKVAKGISILGDLIPLPGSKAVTTVISTSIKYLNDRYETKKIALVSDLIDNVTYLDKELDQVSRILTRMYEPQLELLTLEGAHILAESGVRRIIEYVRADKANDTELLSEQIMHAICTFQTHQGLIPFTDKTIPTKDPVLRWTDVGIFQLSGVETPEGIKYVGDVTKVDIYQYRRAPEAVAIKLGFYRAFDIGLAKTYITNAAGITEEIDGHKLVFRGEATTESLTKQIRDAQAAVSTIITSPTGGAGAGAVPAAPVTSISTLKSSVHIAEADTATNVSTDIATDVLSTSGTSVAFPIAASGTPLSVRNPTTAEATNNQMASIANPDLVDASKDIASPIGLTGNPLVSLTAAVALEGQLMKQITVPSSPKVNASCCNGTCSIQ